MTAEATDSALSADDELTPLAPPTVRESESVTEFDLRTADPISFAVLEQNRTYLYRNFDRLNGFRAIVEGMPTSGEEGRRRGLGWWMLAEYGKCADELEAYDSDDTAAFTRAKALFSKRRFEEAAKIFERLTRSYPAEPRPREGWIESRIEHGLESGADPDALVAELRKEVESAPDEFAESAEGCYLLARLHEVERDWESALDCYERARRMDGTHRALLTRFAHLAERTGLDELAITVYEQLVCQHPADRDSLVNLGVLYEDHGRDSDAAACYDTVSKNDPTDERALLYLADARAAMSSFYDEDLEKKEDRLNQILRIPITDFELSVRARNCLNKMQIATLGDLVQRTEQELLSYKNFGETSLTEIKEILHSKGLRLGMPREEAVASIEAHAHRTAGGDRSDVLNKPILELNLSIRARRTVETLGCLTLGDVAKHSAEELLGMPNFGQTSLLELRSKLADFGLKLKGE